MKDEKTDAEAASLAVSDSRQLATRSASLVKRGLQGLADKRQKRIVKVDDEEALIDVTVEILKTEGYEVRSTKHPTEAIALVTEFQPNVALIDLVMPQMDGFELSRRLSKEFSALKIVLTGYWMGSREIEDEINHLLDTGIICDTFESIFERQDLINMARDWVKGVYHFDSATHLRDAMQFQMEVGRQVSQREWSGESAGCVFVDVLQSGSRQVTEENRELSAAFLRELGAMLRGIAGNGRAYRCKPNEFAVLWPGVSKQETYAKSADFTKNLNWLLNTHKLNDQFSAAIRVATIPADATDGQNL